MYSLYLVRKMHAYPSLIYYLVHIQSGCIMTSFGLILVYMYIAHFHITHFPNLIILVVTKFMLHVFQQIIEITPLEKTLVIYHVNPMCIYPLA